MLHNFSGPFSTNASNDYQSYKWSGAEDLNSLGNQARDKFKSKLLEKVISFFIG